MKRLTLKTETGKRHIRLLTEENFCGVYRVQDEKTGEKFMITEEEFWNAQEKRVLNETQSPS